MSLLKQDVLKEIAKLCGAETKGAGRGKNPLGKQVAETLCAKPKKDKAVKTPNKKTKK